MELQSTRSASGHLTIRNASSRRQAARNSSRLLKTFRIGDLHVIHIDEIDAKGYLEIFKLDSTATFKNPARRSDIGFAQNVNMR